MTTRLRHEPDCTWHTGEACSHGCAHLGDEHASGSPWVNDGQNPTIRESSSALDRAVNDLRWYAERLCVDNPERYEVRQTRDGSETRLSESVSIVLAFLRAAVAPPAVVIRVPGRPGLWVSYDEYAALQFCLTRRLRDTERMDWLDARYRESVPEKALDRPEHGRRVYLYAGEANGIRESIDKEMAK